MIALMLMASGALLYAASRVNASVATTQPEVSTFTGYTVSSTTTVPMTVLDSSRPGVVQVIIADGSGENDDGATRFDPPNMTLVLGVNNTVTWLNQDEITHSVVTTFGFSSGDIAPGHSYTYTFTQTGVYPYHCGYYPIMSGVITVVNP